MDTMDVSSSYTSIPNNDRLASLQCHLNSENCSHTYSVTQLTRFILEPNYFFFDGELYLQEHGTAMGSKMAPQYTNLFMSTLESGFLETCTLQPVLYSRHIYDIFFLWPHGEQVVGFSFSFQ